MNFGNVKKNYMVIGGAGFIGSHFVAELLSRNQGQVKVVDNFCSGTEAHITPFRADSRFELFNIDVEKTDQLIEAMSDIDTVIHLASNPDIARAASEPRIDFVQGTVLTESVSEAARVAGVNTVLYASGSGVYGDAGHQLLTENSALKPISTYGASKLAGESLLSSYSYMFGIKSLAFRFANVVGPMQTHGVGYDFLRRLKINPLSLEILGNGEQSKSYIHVSDVVTAVLFADSILNEGFDVFNISTPDQITVNRIAELAELTLGLNPEKVIHNYSGGDRGWKADVPIVKLSAANLIKYGWNPKLNSEEAIAASLKSMAENLS